MHSGPHPAATSDAARTLKQVFGYDAFLPPQAEIIENVLAGRDTLVVMPTGGGKSLCFQLPALLFQGLTIVVSPLISLMKDQVDQLRELGVAAVCLNSNLAPEDYRAGVSRVRAGEARILYVAPEALLRPSMMEMLSRVPVACMAVDEAHCISSWGHDFRPEYRRLAGVRSRFPAAVCMALTATATPRVRQDIQEALGLRTEDTFIGSFNRENLFIEVAPKEDPRAQTLAFLRRFPGESGIVYAFTRAQVEQLCAFLQKEDVPALPYHAGLANQERDANQTRFVRDDVPVMVATVAFGMGIDKPDVRFVLHYDLPQSLENYYQEIGRAGRDGVKAHCLLLFGYGDLQKARHFIDKKPVEEQRAARVGLGALLGFLETDACRRVPLLAHFGESFQGEACGMCDNCTRGKVPFVDITVPAQKFLSCVKRTGEVFGAYHVIDVLRGSGAKKVLDKGHHTLSTYGIGGDLSRRQWFHISRQLLHRGFITQDMDYGGLRLTDKAWVLLRGEEALQGTLFRETGPAPEEPARDQPCDRELLGLLKKTRKTLADRLSVPPYVIFPDTTLREMATFFPQSPEQLRAIHGVGTMKLGNYGDAFIQVIRGYCEPRNIRETPRRPGRAAKPPSRPLNKPRHQEAGEACQQGTPFRELLARYGVQPRTLAAHLLRFLREGNRLPPEEFYELAETSEDRKRAALEAFERLGARYLKPVADALGGTVAYPDLDLLRLHYLCRNPHRIPGVGSLQEGDSQQGARE